MIIKRPIYNRKLECVALELLAHQQNNTAQTIQHLLEGINQGAEKDYPIFVPYAIKDLLESTDNPIPNPLIYKLRAGEIDTTYSREEIELSPYSIALLIDHPDQLAWLNFAEYIALSELLMDVADVSKVVKFSQSRQRKVIAYGLMRSLNFELCRKMTMDFYCGDFLMQPDRKEKGELAANKLNVLQLISKLQEPCVEFGVISALINSDPLLSYQLLRIANSVAFSGVGSVQSIDQALVRLGVNNLKNWVMVLSMKNISDKPVEVVESGLIRAKMAEKLCDGNSQLCQPNSAYTAGLLSIIDALLNSPMEELVERITIADEIREALLQRTGPLGEILNIVVAYESGRWEDIDADQYNGHDLSESYISSLNEVAKSRKALSGASE